MGPRVRTRRSKRLTDMRLQSCIPARIPFYLLFLLAVSPHVHRAGGSSNLTWNKRSHRAELILCIQQPISDSIIVYPDDFELLVAFRCRDRTLGEALLGKRRSTFENY